MPVPSIVLDQLENLAPANRQAIDPAGVLPSGPGPAHHTGPVKASEDGEQSPKLGHAEGAELFQTGTYHEGTPDEHDWTADDLKQVVANYHKLSVGDSPILPVPLVPGHEEQGEGSVLDHTGLPAYGWLRPQAGAVRLEGDKLAGDFHKIPPEVARLLEQGTYNRISAEIMPNFQHDGVDYGPTLRRVSLLGGVHPEVKTLAPFPAVKFADVGRGQKVLRFCHVFPTPKIRYSEAPSMDRSQMLDALAQLGVPADQIPDTLPDEVLATLLKLCTSHDTAQPEDTTPPAPDAQHAADPTNAEMYVDADSDGNTDPLIGKHADSQAPLNAPGVAADNTTVPSPDPVAPAAATVTADKGALVPGNNQSDKEPSKMSAKKFAEFMASPSVQKFSEIVAREVQAALAGPLKATNDKLAQVDKLASQRLASERKQRVQKFGEDMIREGRLTRGEWEGNAAQKIPGLKHVVMAMDASKTVKFADVSITPLEMLIEVLKHRGKVMRFAEILPDPKTGPTIAPERKDKLMGATPLGREILKRKAAAGK